VASSSTTSTVGPALAEGGEGDIRHRFSLGEILVLLSLAQENMLGQRKMRFYENDPSWRAFRASSRVRSNCTWMVFSCVTMTAPRARPLAGLTHLRLV